MMTVIDPSGTPTPVYNRDGVTLLGTITAAGNSQGTATSIPHFSCHTVFGLASGGAGTGVILPSSADVGDYFDFYSADGVGAQIYPPVGGQFIPTSSFAVNDPVGLSQGRIRKVSSTLWAIN